MSDGVRKRYQRGRRALIALAAVTAGLCGCAANPFLQSGPEPRVENCALTQQATPSRYVCGGKTYTATQLADIRDGKTPLPVMK
jgi:hypothetical protein